MISIKSDDEIEIMARAGKILVGSFKTLEKHLKPGITTGRCDEIVAQYWIADPYGPAGYSASNAVTQTSP